MLEPSSEISTGLKPTMSEVVVMYREDEAPGKRDGVVVILMSYDVMLSWDFFKIAVNGQCDSVVP